MSNINLIASNCNKQRLNNKSVLTPQNSIFNAYKIDQNIGKEEPISGTSKESQISSSSSIQSISSIFLNSNLTTYYQKYKINQQQQNKQQSNRYIADTNTSPQPQQGAVTQNKEDAINRIIRNEKIKQIRIKIYEYELLKEYQTVNTNQEETTKQNDLLIDKKLINRANKLNNKPVNDSQLKYLPRQSEPNNKNIIPITNKSEHNNQLNSELDHKEDELDDVETDIVNETEYDDLLDDDDDLFNDTDSLLDNLDDDNYESGIEDDSFNKYKRSQQDQQIQSNLNRIYQSNNSNTSNKSRRVVKPGFEIYQIGGSSTANFSLCLSSAAQSTFQLKISIISAEVKNIVNVLKQVFYLISYYFIDYIWIDLIKDQQKCPLIIQRIYNIFLHISVSSKLLNLLHYTPIFKNATVDYFKSVLENNFISLDIMGLNSLIK